MANKRILPNLYKRHNVYYYAGRIDGKVKWIRLSSDYQDALHKYADLRSDTRADGTVGSAVRKYRSEVLPGLAPKTQKDRQYQLDRLDKVFGTMPLGAVKPPHIQQYLAKREHKIAANREIKLLSTIYRNAINWGFCTVNPCQGAFYHKEKPRDRYITDNELELLKAKADPTLRAIIDIAYLTGMRRGDILGLQLSDESDEGLFNQQNKTGKRQLFSWTPDLRAAVRAAKQARKTRNLRWLFSNAKGQQITSTGFNSAWRRIRARTGLLDVHFHDIRAKTLTDAKNARGLDYAQALGGHANRDQTEGYVKSKSTEIVEPLK
jgi:integrase